MVYWKENKHGVIWFVLVKVAAHAVMDRFFDFWENEEGTLRGHDFFYKALEVCERARSPGEEGHEPSKTAFSEILTKPELYKV